MSRAKSAASPGKSDSAVAAKTEPGKKAAKNAPAAKQAPPAPPPPLFRKIDWISFGITTLLVLIGYIWTLAPDVTLEDSGELAVGSFYAGVPHPPGYPVWTLYTWVFANFIPISNIAWRVALSSAVAGAISCGLIALLVSRGSSMMIEGIPALKSLDKRMESWLCIVSGLVGGMLLGFNGFMWSQAVIVEVYTLSVLSLMGVLCCLLRWIYAPYQRKYLYWAFFLFGICFTNHQTLLVAAMGIEVAVIAAQPKLGRDMLLGNSICYIIGLILKAKGIITTFDANGPDMNVMFIIFNMVGIASLFGLAMLYFKTEEILTEWKPVLISGACWIVGAAFYFYMPIASMTNPPMNWGYPRTVEGFVHALTRGQYEKANPANFIKDPIRFAQQLGRYAQGAIEEFNLVYLAIGLIPFVFIIQMQHRERAWILGLSAIYLCLAIILLILLNPQPDKQSLNLNKVFFTASHVIIAMGIGYGLALGSAWLMLNYEEYRRWALFAGGAAAFMAVWVLLVVYETDNTVGENHFYRFGVEPSFDPLVRFTAIFGLILAVVFLGLLIFSPKKFPVTGMLALFCILPVKSMLSHWDGNEQRGHIFGYWFGHDMFTPPFDIYPKMAKDAILFGGTDPGRFNPTYMIFCESFVPSKQDPEFNRRDVYLITQNALADGTYLSYIRAHYFRSAQKDPPFFQELVKIGPLKTLVKPLDTIFTSLGAKIEARRRAEGVYPAKEIYTPSNEDSRKAFDEYMTDAVQRMQRNQLQPGEDVHQEGNKVSVSGQVSVMAINGLLTKVIFDKNPDHEFYVEESYPLQWMYPYQTPFGIIMKINRKPVKEFTQKMVDDDHKFWTEYSKRLTGDWINDKTSVQEICDFAEKVYIHNKLSGYDVNPMFVRDENAQKAFSKLRSAIAGLYVWRINNCANQLKEIDASPGGRGKRMQEYERLLKEQARVIKEADFAYRQSFAFCPYSPEAVFRYTSLLTSLGRFDDAYKLVMTALKFDPEYPAFQSLRDQLTPMMNQGQPGNHPATAIPAPNANGAAPTPAQAQAPGMSIPQLEAQVKADPGNIQATFNLVTTYIGMGNTNRALQLLDQMVTSKPNDFMTVASAAQAQMQLQRPTVAVSLLNRLLQHTNLDANQLTTVAHLYSQLGQVTQLEIALTRLTTILKDNPEAWYDLAAIRAVAGNKNKDALQALSKAVQLSNARRAKDPGASNLQQMATSDGRFQALRADMNFSKALEGKY